MNLERIVQLHVAALAIFGAVLLGMGQQSPVLPLLAVFAALTSILFTDVLGWFRLNRFVANVAMMLALFFSLNDFLQPDMRTQLMAIANLLIYLQIVLFYQQKNPRLYWQLTVLSLLQVVVSAALNVGFEFGLVLILYAAVAFSTLAVLHVHREGLRVFELASRWRSRREGEGASSEATGKPSDHWQRWLRREPIVRPLMSSTRLGRQVLTNGLLTQIAAIGLSTLIFAFVLFFTAPRLDSSQRRSYSMRPTRVVGFSDEVRLDEMTSILESSETVMRVSFREAASQRTYKVYGEPYFRGVVLTQYECQEGVARWRQPDGIAVDRISRFRLVPPSGRLPDPPPKFNLVQQDIIMQPLSQQVLFAVYPFYACLQTPEDIRFQPRAEQMFCKTHREERPRTEYLYSVVTTGLLGGLQLEITRVSPNITNMIDPDLLAFDESQMPTIKKIADEIAASRRDRGGKRSELARALREHFLKPGAYRYTLDFARIRRQRQLDVIEDFVKNHRSGHCEYFASALVMMLRSQNIPARLMVGFRGGEYNALGGYYQVQQRHAHAWVEAYLAPEQAKLDSPQDADTSPLGGWLRLDPTPGSDVDPAPRQLERGWIDVADDVLDYARTMWTDYILGLTAKRQQESIYDPVAVHANPETLGIYALQRLDTLRVRVWRWLQSITWLLGMAALFALGSALVLYRRTRQADGKPKPRPALWQWRRVPGESAQAPACSVLTVGFYRRLEAALLRLGLSRAVGQTPRELASQASDRLAALSPQTAVAELPSQIVERFYRVRFGKADLPEDDGPIIDGLLTRLEQVVGDIMHPPAQDAGGSEQA